MAPLATAYSGPPKLTLGTAFTQWRLDVPMLVLIVALGAWYQGEAAVRKFGLYKVTKPFVADVLALELRM